MLCSGGVFHTIWDHVFYKLVLELAADDFIASCDNCIHLLLWQNTQFVVGKSSSLFDVSVCLNEVGEMVKRLRVKREIFQGT
jgi:hypothetical protein